jgi:hypothetical protein
MDTLHTESWEEMASALPRDATDTHRLMVAVYFRFQHEQTDTTDMSAIANDYFRRARWPRPINQSATANHCASKGWLSEVGKADGRKLWRITRKGYKYIQLQLSPVS